MRQKATLLDNCFVRLLLPELVWFAFSEILRPQVHCDLSYHTWTAEDEAGIEVNTHPNSVPSAGSCPKS